ncbi:hypothetical protein HDU76_012842 [Blyttiomyces sp. JEL0837]|nr:hypothetical protein HDU76_012842 [Blyttiomyces sp. JEL0837]
MPPKKTTINNNSSNAGGIKGTSSSSTASTPSTRGHRGSTAIGGGATSSSSSTPSTHQRRIDSSFGRGVLPATPQTASSQTPTKKTQAHSNALATPSTPTKAVGTSRQFITPPETGRKRGRDGITTGGDVEGEDDEDDDENYQEFYIGPLQSKKSKKNVPKALTPSERKEMIDTLKQFDLNMKFGPNVGISRLERWERANKLGLAPPQDVGEILKSDLVQNDVELREALWHGIL